MAEIGWDVLYILTGARSGSSVGAPGGRAVAEKGREYTVAAGREPSTGTLSDGDVLACWQELSPSQRRAVAAVMRELCRHPMATTPDEDP
jgi:hypothetical protein